MMNAQESVEFHSDLEASEVPINRDESPPSVTVVSAKERFSHGDPLRGRTCGRLKGSFRGFLFFFPLLLMIITSCNVLQEGEGLPVISANVLPSTAGSVLISGQGSEDQQVELLAVANDNWRFSGWSGDVESEENPLNITLTQNTELFANFVLAGNEYQVNMELSDGENSSALSFGQILNATDGFDTDLDLEAPPPPPDGVLYAWFEGNDRNLLNDFRNPYTNSVEWMLTINPGDSGLMNLDWNVETEDISGSLIFTNSNESISINMLEESSVELNLSDEAQYRILYSP